MKNFNLPIEMEEALKAKITVHCEGNPRFILDFIKRFKNDFSLSPNIDLDNVVDKGTKRNRNVLPFIGLILCLLIPLRYISYITENSLHKIIGTVAFISFVGARYISRLFRK